MLCKNKLATFLAVRALAQPGHCKFYSGYYCCILKRSKQLEKEIRLSQSMGSLGIQARISVTVVTVRIILDRILERAVPARATGARPCRRCRRGRGGWTREPCSCWRPAALRPQGRHRTALPRVRRPRRRHGGGPPPAAGGCQCDPGQPGLIIGLTHWPQAHRDWRHRHCD